MIKSKLVDLGVETNFLHDRTILSFNQNLKEKVIEKISYVSGIHSYSLVYETKNDLESIISLSNEIIAREITSPTTFKVETRRRDKNYPITSLEVTLKVAPMILKIHGALLTVDVRKPQNILNIEINKDSAYVYIKTYPGMGGFPVGMGGKALVLMSGGIDSPVASFLTMKHGVELELFHFESTPLTPLESVQKVIDLAKLLSNYMPKNSIKLHLVPFTTIHKEILEHVNDSYIITIMRRIMFRMAERFAFEHKHLAIVTGESIGQVASQTLESMLVVENVTNIPILRPLITYDKNDIIELARKINSFDISIRPFNDCCSIYIPKSPVIKPTIKTCEINELKFDYEILMNEALEGIKTVILTPTSDFIIHDHGFDVFDALENYKGK